MGLGLAWLGALLLIGACQAQAPPASEPATEAELLARIRAEIGDARCAANADCRTLAIGERACGGPAAWWAWSIAVSRPDHLSAVATELAALQRQRHEKSGMRSTCEYFADPGALCRAQRCVTRTAANAD